MINLSNIKQCYLILLQKNTQSNDPVTVKTSNGKTMVLSKCVVCGARKSKFIKQREAKALLSNLGIRTPLSKILLLGDILF